VNTRNVAVLAAVLLTSLFAVKAQEADRVYLNEVLASTSKKTAKYYRIPEGRDGDLFIGRTYSIDGRLKTEGTYADPELQIEHGLFTFYHVNGTVESKGEYMMGSKNGVWERYDNAGRQLAEKIYDPTPLENIIYTRAETMPSHNHGSDKEFIRYIKAKVTPTKGKRVKGSVTTCFVVEKDGSLSDVKVVKGTDAKVNDQVVQAIRATAPWQPGTDKGQPVRVIVRMPVQF
jgi:TonB family protein